MKREIPAVANVKLEAVSARSSPMHEILYETTPTRGEGDVDEQEAANFNS
jgi:hypothetical protein